MRKDMFMPISCASMLRSFTGVVAPPVCTAPFERGAPLLCLALTLLHVGTCVRAFVRSHVMYMGEQIVHAHVCRHAFRAMPVPAALHARKMFEI